MVAQPPVGSEAEAAQVATAAHSVQVQSGQPGIEGATGARGVRVGPAAPVAWAVLPREDRWPIFTGLATATNSTFSDSGATGGAGNEGAME